jgi:hypothetical protein
MTESPQHRQRGAWFLEASREASGTGAQPWCLLRGPPLWPPRALQPLLEGAPAPASHMGCCPVPGDVAIFGGFISVPVRGRDSTEDSPFVTPFCAVLQGHELALC